MIYEPPANSLFLQNLDLEDINVRNAQFKNFDTIVRMKLKPVWHKVGAKTKIHVAALTELRNLHTWVSYRLHCSRSNDRFRWLLEYDSATFASYINTLQRQHFQAERLTTGAGRHIHDWFNAKAASQLVEASQARVSRRKMVMDNIPGPEEDADRREVSISRDEGVDSQEGEYGLEEEALREQELAEQQRREIQGIVPDDDEEEIMEIFATQTQTLPQHHRPNDADNDLEQGPMAQDENSDETLRSAEGVPPPVFRPVMLSVKDDLGRSVEKRLKKGYEAVLEEQPKWSVLAKVLKEIEDTIASVQVSHAGMFLVTVLSVMTVDDTFNQTPRERTSFLS